MPKLVSQSSHYHAEWNRAHPNYHYRWHPPTSERQLHGRSRTPEYKSWCQMNSRCSNPRDIGWPLYGGRGIYVCDRWRHDFMAFLEDMGEKLRQGHSIDRIDVNRGYEPGNCRWVSPKQQARNTRRNLLLEYNGHTATLVEWAEITGIQANTIRMRLVARHWTAEEALTTPVRSRRMTTTKESPP